LLKDGYIQPGSLHVHAMGAFFGTVPRTSAAEERDDVMLVVNAERAASDERRRRQRERDQQLIGEVSPTGASTARIADFLRRLATSSALIFASRRSR